MLHCSPPGLNRYINDMTDEMTPEESATGVSPVSVEAQSGTGVPPVSDETEKTGIPPVPLFKKP